MIENSQNDLKYERIQDAATILAMREVLDRMGSSSFVRSDPEDAAIAGLLKEKMARANLSVAQMVGFYRVSDLDMLLKRLYVGKDLNQAAAEAAKDFDKVYQSVT